MGFFNLKVGPRRIAEAPTFPYRGGKAILRRYIIRWFPLEGSVYCEPFVGRANVFFAAKIFGKFRSWHLNDFSTIPFLEAIKKYSGEEIPKLYKADYLKLQETDPNMFLLLHPIYTWCGDGRSVTGYDNITKPDLIRYRKRLVDAKILLAETVMTKENAIVIIQKYGKDKNAFLYLDPPYKNANVGSYIPEDIDRTKMFSLLKKAKCRWVLSEYWQEDIVAEFGLPFTQIKNVSFNPTQSSPQSKRRVTECLWKNFGPSLPSKIITGSKFKILPKTMKLFVDNGGDLSLEEWNNISPKHWKYTNVKMEFYMLTIQPQCYYNGDRVKLISKMDPV
jgi:site-specific DNA-adenine methylase